MSDLTDMLDAAASTDLASGIILASGLADSYKLRLPLPDHVGYAQAMVREGDWSRTAMTMMFLNGAAGPRRQ